MTNFLHRMSGPGSAGDLWISTLHSSSAATLQAAHDAWGTFINGLHTNILQNMWTPATAIYDTETVELHPTTGKQVAKLASGVNKFGDEALGGCVSPRDCLVVGLRTGIPTKSGRGRMFLPGPSTTWVGTDGLLIGTKVDQWALALAPLLAAMAAVTRPSIYHHATKTSDPITAVHIGTVMGSQKRRTNRVFNAYSTVPV